MIQTDFGTCAHGVNALQCTHSTCLRAMESRARLIHMSTSSAETAAARLRKMRPTSNKNKRLAYCVHYPHGTPQCKRCRARAREEVLKIMLEQNGDQHLCPWLYE